MMHINTKICPCGRLSSYENCCAIIHKNIVMALTAEDLMRSRYTAFTKANGDYLMQSHHASTRLEQEKKEIVAWAKSVKWLKLEVLTTSNGLKNDTVGTVMFKAHFEENGKHNMIQENSKFVKENGCWLYLDRI